MLNIDFFNPVKIISGAGCFRSFSDYAAFGSRCLIVCGQTSARKCGALADAEASLAKAGVAYKIFDKIEQNPLITTVYEGGRIARDWNADFILAIGGGSPLDAGKAVAAYAANPEMQPEELFTAARKPALPLLSVNTTAGTGSEVTPYSILTVPSIEKSAPSPATTSTPKSPSATPPTPRRCPARSPCRPRSTRSAMPSRAIS